MIPNWTALRTFGNNKILRSSFIWLALVPVIAKVLNRMDSIFTISILGKNIELSIALPFSWALFFYGSLFATIANIIFSINCPEIIKNYMSFQDYKDSGRGNIQLGKDFIAIFASTHKKLKENEIIGNAKEYIGTYCDIPNEGNRLEDLYKKLDEGKERSWNAVIRASQETISQTRTADAFWFVREFADRLYPYYRASCGIFYGLAFFCFTILGVQNIVFVIRWQLGLT